MTKFKPPKVIYLQVFDDDNEATWCKDRIDDNDIAYVRINKHWKKKFKKQFPMLCSKETGVVGFIEKMIS